MTKPIFSDPADGLEPPDILRTSIDFSRRNIAFLRSIHGRANTGQVTTNILLDKLEQFLLAHDINSYDPDAYERTVANIEFTLADPNTARPRSTTPVATARRVNTRTTKGAG